MLPFKNKALLYPIVNIEAAACKLSFILTAYYCCTGLGLACTGPNSLDPMYYIIFHYFDSRSTQLEVFYKNYKCHPQRRGHQECKINCSVE